MFDFANVTMMGRATDDAILINIDNEEKISKANLTIACNISIRKTNDIRSYTIYRKIIVLGSFANYIAKCQDQDGIKGRLIVLTGIMDNEFNDQANCQEIIRVSPPCGSIKIMDRRNV